MSEVERVGRATPKTLVVEDDMVLRAAIRGALGDAGFYPIECADLATARESIARMQPNVIVLDLSLGGEFGGQLLEELAQLEDAPAVVICSAFSLAGLVAARFSIPCVKKPFDLEVLVREVQRAVDQGLRPRRVSDAPTT